MLDHSVQKSEVKIVAQPTEVKDDHIPSTSEESSPKKRPNIVGIKGFSESKDDVPEI
jgi:hypothetical protein